MVSKPTMNTNTSVKGVIKKYMKVCLFLLTGLSLTHHWRFSTVPSKKLGEVQIKKKISFHTILLKDFSYHSWYPHEWTLSLVHKYLSLPEGASCWQTSRIEFVLCWRLGRPCSVLCWWLCLQGVPRAKSYSVKLKTSILIAFLRWNWFITSLYNHSWIT